MKHFFNWTALAVVTLSLGSCGGSTQKDKKEAVGLQDRITDTMYQSAVDSVASGGNGCLLEYQDNYDKLIDEAEVLSITGFSKPVMQTKANKMLKNKEHHSFEFRFANKRKGKVSGFPGDVEVKDLVKVSGINPMSLVQFKSAYRVMGEREAEKAKEALVSAVDGNSGGKEAEKAMKKAKERNVDSETIKKTGGGILNAIKEVSKSNVSLAGLGDAAVWNSVTGNLYVLKRGVKFELVVDVSNDNEKNKALAVTLAERILEKCN